MLQTGRVRRRIDTRVKVRRWRGCRCYRVVVTSSPGKGLTAVVETRAMGHILGYRLFEIHSRRALRQVTRKVSFRLKPWGPESSNPASPGGSPPASATTTTSSSSTVASRGAHLTTIITSPSTCTAKQFGFLLASFLIRSHNLRVRFTLLALLALQFAQQVSGRVTQVHEIAETAAVAIAEIVLTTARFPEIGDW